MLVVPLFLAGLITILLPCILPLIPIVLGVSIAGRSRWRPFFTVLGLFLSFVGFTFLLQVVLSQFVELADYIRISTYYILFLFGVGFLTSNLNLQLLGAVVGGLFYWDKGWIAVTIAECIGSVLVPLGSKIAARIQQWGSRVQEGTRSEFGGDSSVTAFLIGMTLGLVWVPCAGPALAFALTLVREKPGLEALGLLSVYSAGASVPLLIIGYGGQFMTQSVRALTKYSGRIKQVSGVLLIFSALALQYNWFLPLQTKYGDLGTALEERLFSNMQSSSSSSGRSRSSATVEGAMGLPKLPKIIRAPEFTELGPWHNSQPFTLASLKGKVVLIDFWTYSCINCIRTLPYVEGYWEKFKDKPFVLLGVHTPEFIFEKNEKNVAAAIKEHGLTYPVAQDNNYGTWNAFANRYWPAKYLIDADGYIRYTHFGEGGYEETDLAIQSLLAEIGVTTNGKLTPLRPLGFEGQEIENGKLENGNAPDGNRNRSPETYFSSRNWPSFGNGSLIPSGGVNEYTAPSSMKLNSYYLVGTWQLKDDEYEELQSDQGEIAMKFLGTEINLVLGLAEGATPVKADVEIDGKPVKTITIDRHDLFNLYKGDYGEHDMVLKIHGKGLEAYAFTFGG